MHDAVAASNVYVWIFTSAAIIATVFRLFARLKLTNLAGIDDVFITFSLLIFITASGLYSWSTSKGIGMHLDQLDFAQAVESGRTGVIANVVGMHTFSWPKLSVVALISRTFNPRRCVVITFYTAVVLLITCSFILGIFDYVQCKPAAGAWNPTVDAKCWPRSVYENFGIFLGSFSAFLDFALAVYPAYMTRGLHMKTDKKVSLCIIMGAGLSACGAAIVKTIKVSGLGMTSDITYDVAIVDVWQAVETGLIFLAANLPALRPFFKFVHPESIRMRHNLFSRTILNNDTSNNESHEEIISVSHEPKRASTPSIASRSETRNLSATRSCSKRRQIYECEDDQPQRKEIEFATV